jgi:hypothetical protein
MTQPQRSKPIRHMRCPECGRVSSVPEWVARPICVHAWLDCGPEIWNGDDSDGDGHSIEVSASEKWREPGPGTWTEMEACCVV